MAEVTKKKSPAKSSKNRIKNDKTLHAQAKAPSHDEISLLARKFWAERGYQDGYAELDWIRAEQELQQ